MGWREGEDETVTFLQAFCIKTLHKEKPNLGH